MTASRSYCHILVLALMLVLGLVLAGCGAAAGAPGGQGGAVQQPGAGTGAAPSDQPGGLPSTPPDIEGSITRLTQGQRASLLVEENPAQDSGSDKAVLRLTEKARIFRQQGKLLQPATLADLAQGQQVRVWFDGPVAESYPVQANAGVIVIAGQ